MQPDRPLIRAGFVLLCLGLATGFIIPDFLNPKMGLAAHLTGILNALMLLAVGFAWPLFRLPAAPAKVTRGLFLFAAFTNWAGSCLAATWGTGRLTPLSSPGYSADAWKETIVQSLQISVALASLTGGILVVYALRPAKSRK